MGQRQVGIKRWGLLTLWAHTRTGALGCQSRRRTKPRREVLARTATPSGAPGRPFPSGCCRKRRSRRCKVSPGALPAFAFAPCARRFRLRNAFVSIALTGPSLPPFRPPENGPSSDARAAARDELQPRSARCQAKAESRQTDKRRHRLTHVKTPARRLRTMISGCDERWTVRVSTLERRHLARRDAVPAPGSRAHRLDIRSRGVGLWQTSLVSIHSPT